MQIQPISAAEVAQAVRAWVPGAVEVRLLPHVSDARGVVRHSTWVAFYAADGVWIGDVSLSVSEMLLRPLSALPGRDVDRPQVFDVAAAEWLPAAPALSPVVPLHDSPLAVDPYRDAQLEAQRHELEDDAELPRAVVEPDPARDCARSLADGLMTPVDWSDCDPTPAPARPVADVPVVGEAL